MSKLQILSVDGLNKDIEAEDVTKAARAIVGPTVRVTVKDNRLVMLVQKKPGLPNPLASSIAGREIKGDAILCERRFL
ncbi:MAG: hypothetical protein JW901_05285 [Dehalococcoidia bacterium]|nr:hypothetical protein [Dehalococcoidia bacterium]